MKQLHHPNIIQFVEVFEDLDSLMVVMEYAPGQELFDVRTKLLSCIIFIYLFITFVS